MHQVGQDVAGAQEHIDDIGCRGQAAAAHTIEHGLENMGECDQRLKAEYAGAALDRVNATEHRIDRIVGPLTVPEFGQSSLDLLQCFVAFIEEGLL